jgi:hypothetical protein
MAGFQVIMYGRFWVFTEVGTTRFQLLSSTLGRIPPDGPIDRALTFQLNRDRGVVFHLPR